MRSFHRFTCLLFTLLLGFSAALPAIESSTQETGHKQLIMLFSPMNKPPFWYFEADQPRGILYDLLQEVGKEQGYRIDAQGVSRNRGNRQVQENPHLVISRALEWVDDPSLYAISDPIINNPDIFVSALSNPVEFKNSPSELQGQIISTHIGYVYPTIDPLFEQKVLIRSDTSDEYTMLRRVYKQRTQAALISRPVARWYIKQNHWQRRFYLSRNILSDVELRLFFHPSQKEFVQQFNQAIKQMRQDGRYQQIVDRYL